MLDASGRNVLCGERGIRTLGTIARTLPFQGSALDHSAISPLIFYRRYSTSLFTKDIF